MQPPNESGLDNSVALKLNKCVYGLVDASRNWLLSVKNGLIQLKYEQSKLDPAPFYWFHKGKLEGLFLMHVEDFLWSGSELFNVTIISLLRKKIRFGKESDSRFRCIGLHIEQTNSRGTKVEKNANPCTLKVYSWILYGCKGNSMVYLKSVYSRLNRLA